MSAVTLDLWHTLMYLPPEDEEAYMTHQLTMGREVLTAAPPLPGAAERTPDELGRAFERAYTWAVEESSHGRTVTPAEQLRRAAQETGRAADPQAYLDKLRAEVARTPFRRAPGAIELLEGLRQDGYRVAVISNTVGEPGAFLRPVLSSMGFDRYVETFVFSDEEPWCKPSPEIFYLALRRLGTQPDDAVHVGDSWSDLEGPRRAGYRAAILFTGLHAYGERYRELFLPKTPDEPSARFQADRLVKVEPMIRELLPP